MEKLRELENDLKKTTTMVTSEDFMGMIEQKFEYLEIESKSISTTKSTNFTGIIKATIETIDKFGHNM